MIKKNNVVIFVILFFSLFTETYFCQTTGKVIGKIIDSTNSQPLIGANVLIEGTSLGAASDVDGNYLIQNVPAGNYSLKTTYIGYKTIVIKVKVEAGKSLEQNIELEPVSIVGQTVIVTAQASGQNAAINQQLSSDKIVNIVSSARIKELPDANAAESVGRLPGVFLVRSYGEGAQVAIRGLEPKYNKVLIDGVEMPANDVGSNASGGNRGEDMSMISSDMLSGIELYKTVTPDMDAAVLGGTVNFQIREAQKTSLGLPQINLLLQGGYNNLQNTYNDYKFSASIEKRFLENNFGIYALGVIEKKNLTSDNLGGNYDVIKHDYFNPVPVIMNKLQLQYQPTDKRRYNGTLVLDYKWNNGKIDLMNFFSKGTQTTKTFEQSYNIASNNNSITYQTSYFEPILNQITNILDFQQDLLNFKMDARLSHAYSENINPGQWGLTFTQGSVWPNGVNQNQNPEQIAREASTAADLSNTNLSNMSTNSSFIRQRNIAGAVDLERMFNLSNFITAKLKFGGRYKYTYRAFDYSSGSGSNLDNPAEGAQKIRADIIAANPWMSQPPYNLRANGYDKIPITVFFDHSTNFGKFLGGSYSLLGSPTNVDLLSQVSDLIIASSLGKPASTGNFYAPDEKANIGSDYSGYEYENAAYIMATVNFGPQVTLITGIRYQGIRTRYTAAFIPLWGSVNTYPNPFPHMDTTASEYHGYWLPNLNLRYRPFSWFDIRLSYTNTLSYPDFRYITPQIHINSSVSPGNVERWNNTKLKPAFSQNYDLSFSFYNNAMGLFTFNPFLKRIDDFIFSYGGFAITNPSIYPLPAYTKNYNLTNTQINNPNRVDLWGIELDWQTHFWYLPSILSGLVLNVNYTHIFSQAKYPIHFSVTSGFPPKTTQVDTFYTARLIDQPSDIVNLSLGYDYKDFSARVSMALQDNVFSGTAFWPQLRKSKSKYTRWDFQTQQKLPWFGVEAFFNIYNINGEPDTYVIQGTGFPNNEESYGMTANLGIRWKFE